VFVIVNKINKKAVFHGIERILCFMVPLFSFRALNVNIGNPRG
jgi:hypothetical protein